MREAERKRLVKLIGEAKAPEASGIGKVTDELIADYILDGGVIVPPCKVGDKVYRIYANGWIGEDKVFGFSATESGLRYYDNKGVTSCDKFGKTVFLSKAEAEYALKNRRSVSLVNGHIEE